jgi:hypothetical protein
MTRRVISCCDAVGTYTRYLDIHLHACRASACLRGFGHVQTGKEVQDDAGKARESHLRATPCQPERACASAARSRARQACMLALMRSRQADALTPKISTTGMKTGTNTLTDISSPAIPPIVRATRRQTESAASAELRTTCEHSWHSGPAGDAVRSRIRSIVRRSRGKGYTYQRRQVAVATEGRLEAHVQGHDAKPGLFRRRHPIVRAHPPAAWPTRPRPATTRAPLFATRETDGERVPFTRPRFCGDTVPTTSNLQYWLRNVQFPYKFVGNCHKAGTVLMESLEDIRTIHI